MSLTHLNTISEYCATEIMTMYNNNIIQRFDSYVGKYIDFSFNKSDTIRFINQGMLV